MRIAICDDESIYRDDLINHLKAAFGGQLLQIQCYDSGETLLSCDEEADFLFLDIEMKEIDGIAVKDLLEKNKSMTKIIFLTSHRERMAEAFGLNVIGFLEKPLETSAFEALVKKMKDMSFQEMVEWSEGGENYCIPMSKIRYVEAQDKYTALYTLQDKYLVRRTVKEWEQILPETSFCRVNRSYLIHFDLYIYQI